MYTYEQALDKLVVKTATEMWSNYMGGGYPRSDNKLGYIAALAVLYDMKNEDVKTEFEKELKIYQDNPTTNPKDIIERDQFNQVKRFKDL